MENLTDIVLEIADSLLDSAALDSALPGISLAMVLAKVALRWDYPKKGKGEKLSPRQIQWLKDILGSYYEIQRIGRRKYYTKRKGGSLS